jgi:hypothetical protein
VKGALAGCSLTPRDRLLRRPFTVSCVVIRCSTRRCPRNRRCTCRTTDHAVRQIPLLCHRRGGDGPALGLRRNPEPRARRVLRARRLRHGHVPDARDRGAGVYRSKLPDFMVFSIGKSCLVLEAVRQLRFAMLAALAVPGLLATSSVSSRSVRAFAACTSRSSRRRSPTR